MKKVQEVNLELQAGDLLYNWHCDLIATFTGNIHNRGKPVRPDGSRLIELLEVLHKERGVQKTRYWFPDHCRRVSAEEAERIRTVLDIKA